jgi:hypothetical protein
VTYPQQQPPYAPTRQQPPKKRHTGRNILLGVVAVVVVAGIASAVSSSNHGSTPTASSSATALQTTAQASPTQARTTRAAAPQLSEVQLFQKWVAGHEGPKTAAAAKHVTKIQGADQVDNIMDSADVYTDYTGGLMGGDTGNAQLIVSAFSDWQTSRGKHSSNGLVTVYDQDGNVLGNGNW